MSGLIIKCDECEHEFSTASVKINEAKVMIHDQPLTLIYFACPECNKIYRIALKDKRCEELEEDIEKTKNRIRKNHGSNNDELARVLDVMVTKKCERLKAHIAGLNKMFPGTFTFEVSENNQKDNIIKYLP